MNQNEIFKFAHSLGYSKCQDSALIFNNLQTQLDMPRFTDQWPDIYARHLFPQRRGYPLWTPEPSLELLDCRSDGHAIGDIGIVVPEDGRFEVFFNICLPPTHPVNQSGVPRNFQTIALEDRSISTTANAEKPGCIIRSSHIKIEEQSSWTRTRSELEYTFNLSCNEGSLLALPEGAVRSDLLSYHRFKPAIIQQGEDWCHFIEERVGRGYDSFYLVTGLHKTRSWSLAAFPKTEKTAECPARLKISQLWREDVTDATHWETRRDLESRTGPMSYGDLNQTVFVRGLKITMNTRKFRRDGPKITAVEDVLSTSTLDRPGSNGVVPDAFNPFYLSRGLFTSRANRSSGRGIWDEPEDDNPRDRDGNREGFVVGDDIVVEPIPELSPAFHPSDVINRYLLTKEPSANIAFTHDDDWIAMLEEDQLKLEDFAQNGRFETLISQKYDIVLKEGVVYLENQSHRSKDVDSDSASQPQHLGGSEVNPVFFAEDGSQIISGETKGTKVTAAEHILITYMRATDLACRLRRLPAGFYVTVEFDGISATTSNKTVSISRDVAEWDDEILLPPTRSSVISFQVYAPFEQGPRLGSGELLGRCEISVEEVLDRSERLEPIRFIASRDECLLSCLSLRVVAKRRHCDGSECKVRPELPKSAIKSEAEELTDEGHRALLCYRRSQDQSYLYKAIQCFERVHNNCPIDCPNRSAALFNLANAKFIHCQAHNHDLDLDMSITLYRDAIRIRTTGHPDHVMTVLELGFALLTRFQRRGHKMDKMEAMDLLHRVVELAPADSHIHRAGRLTLQMISVSLRTSDPETPDDMDDMRLIDRTRAMLQTLSHWDPRYPKLLVQLGMLLWLQFEEHGDLIDIDEAVSVLDEAVLLVPNDHADKPRYLNALGVLLLSRFERLGDVADIVKSVSIQEEAVCLTPGSYPDTPSLLSNLGSSLLSRFERLGHTADITKSVSMKEEAVRLTPDGHPDKPSLLNNLGNSLLRRFERLGDVADIAKSVSVQEEAVRLTPDSHPDKPSLLNNLGYSLQSRFERLGDVADIAKSVSTQEEAIHLTPNGHPDRPARLNNLGNSLLTRFERLGDVADIAKSVSTQEEAIHLTPDGHPDKPGRLNNLGNSLLSRFQCLGDATDITKSVLMKEEAVRLTPDDHPDKPSLLNSLGNSLLSRFERLGDVADIMKSVSTQEEAIRLTPDGHPDKPGRLNDLGNSLLSRFECLGDVVDITKSVFAQEEAVRLTPDGHPDKPSLLIDLGKSLSSRFKQLGDIMDIMKSISTFEEAARLMPDGHPNEPGQLGALENMPSRRFEHLGDVADITKAVLMIEK